MRRIFIVIIFIVCTNILLSCGLASDEKSVEQTSEFAKNQYEEFDNKVDGLSESDLEELKWLIQTLHVSHGGASNILGNGSVLDTKEKQAKFLDILNEMEYENIFKNSLKKYVIFEDDRKFINIENVEIVLKMAGALSTVEVWQYLSQNYSQYMESEDIFEMPLYAREGSDNYIEFRDWEFIVEEDGKLTVRYKIYNPFSYMYIDNVDVRLHKNEQSIFGGYSADYLMVAPIETENTTYENEELFSGRDWGEYKKPMTMGKSIDDYIFKLDGSLYQMPCPLDEFLLNGWKYNGKLKKSGNYTY